MGKKQLNILVTGANGQLGRCIQDVAKDATSLNFVFKDSKQLDITNQGAVKNIFNTSRFDYCINCAAYTAVDKAEAEKEKAFLVNAEAVKYLAESCKENNVKLIHISTDFVFDGKKETPYTEESIPNPINVYGASKLKGEQYIQNHIERYFIIRTSWVYSEYGHNFVKTMLRLTQERNQISVVNDQIGSPTYAGDLANVILEIIGSDLVDYGVYHYSNEGEISWYDFAQAIFEEKNVELVPISTEEYPTPAKRPSYSVMDKTKIKQSLKIEIPYWKDTLQKTKDIK